MSRRIRALAFATGALLCAALAAGLASGYRTEIAAEYGALRSVVATVESLPPRRVLRPKVVERSLEVRRVPERFVPPDALAIPEEAVGRAPAAPLPAGSYLLASHLLEAASPKRSSRRPGPGRAPVDIAVAAAGGLIRQAGGQLRRVDVVVVSEPGPGRRGRTSVAAEGVRLLDLRPADADAELSPGPTTGSYVATLALTRAQAVRLIQAESFARQVRLIAR
jgi:Flp pilus assembly protein CpaB